MDFQLMDILNMTAHNTLAQTIKKNIYVPYDVLEIIFVVTIYQKWEFFGFCFFFQIFSSFLLMIKLLQIR